MFFGDCSLDNAVGFWGVFLVRGFKYGGFVCFLIDLFYYDIFCLFIFKVSLFGEEVVL